MLSRDDLKSAVRYVESLDPLEARRRLVQIVKDNVMLLEIIRGHMTDPALQDQSLAVFSGQRDIATTNTETALGHR